MNEQHATLQRMLYDAGVTHEQLGTLGDDIEADTAMRIELWALAEELLWQLHSAANQLKRRWQATEPALPHPPALAAWFAKRRVARRTAGCRPLTRRWRGSEAQEAPRHNRRHGIPRLRSSTSSCTSTCS